VAQRDGQEADGRGGVGARAVALAGGLVAALALALLLWPAPVRNGPRFEGVPPGAEDEPGTAQPAPMTRPTLPPPPAPAPKAGAAPAPAPAPALETAPMPRKTLTEFVEYRDGERRARVWRNPRILVQYTFARDGRAPRGAPSPPVEGARLVRKRLGAHVWLLPAGTSSADLEGLELAEDAGPVSAGYHDAPDTASNLRGLPGGVVVKFPPDWSAERIASWAALQALGAMTKMTVEPNWYTFETAAGEVSLEVARRLLETGEVLAASPNWWRERRLR
jgi:hypothetical protein